jgi:hypothetical protein
MDAPSDRQPLMRGFYSPFSSRGLFRLLCTFGAICCVTSSFADRLILIPVGKKLPYRTYRLELQFDNEIARPTIFAGAGISTSLELEVIASSLGARDELLSLDLHYNYLAPLLGLAPGISAGIQDISNVTATGRRIYIVMTQRQPYVGWQQSGAPTELTVGLSMGQIVSPFGGILVPLTGEFRLMAEFDTRRLTGGFEVRPAPGWAVRWMHRQNQNLWSVSLTSRW